MRILFWLLALVIIALLVRDRWQHWRRHRRGEPAPAPHPRAVSLLVAALVLVYGLLIGYRIFVGS